MHRFTFTAGYDNQYCRFAWQDGSTTSGVISSFFPSDPLDLSFVSVPELVHFRELLARKDYPAMRVIARRIDLDALVSAEFILN